MPRIQQYGSPTVGPVQATNARFRPADNGGGAAGAVARGLQRMGQVGADVAQVQAKIEDDLARTNADNLFLSASTAANGAVNDLKSKMGKGALDHRPIAGKAVEDAMSATLAQADQRTRRYLEPQLARLRASTDAEMSGYAVQQNRVYQQEVGKAKIENSFQMAVSADDPAKRAGFIQEIRDQTRLNLEMVGQGDSEIIEAEERKAVSGTHLAVAQRYMAKKDFDMADAYRLANLKDMTVGDQATLTASLAAPMLKRWAEQKFAALTVLPSIGAEPGKGGSGNPVSDGGAAIKSLFPGVAITSTYRAPDHPLSKANPKSWHTKSHAAVDVKPIAGMTFDQYVKQVEGAGYTVLEAINEVGAGRSKHATGDHWHIVLGKGGGGTPPSARKWDLEATTQGIYAQAEKEGWSLEERDAVLGVAKDRAALDGQLLAQKEEQTFEAALTRADALGDNFTSVSQLGPLFGSLPIRQQITIKNMAEANQRSIVAASRPKDGSDTYTALHNKATLSPGEFISTDLRAYKPLMTQGNFSTLSQLQAKIKAEGVNGKEVSSRSAISSTIAFYSKIDGQDLDPAKNGEQFTRVFDDMNAFLTEITDGKKRRPTDADLKTAYDRATMQVRQAGSLWGFNNVRRYNVEPGTSYAVDIDPATRKLIVDRYKKRNGQRAPTEDAITQIFIAGKGQPGLW